MVDLFDADIQQLRHGLDSGLFTCVQLVKAYLGRIANVNDELHCVIEVNNNAIQRGEICDKERTERYKDRALPLLHGIPILLKDNIATSEDDMQTTSGSYALLGCVVPREAFVVTKLLDQGAIILGKANLSEWSYFRGRPGKMPGGWSARGGQCTNPYLRKGQTRGSSSGSAVAVAVGLAAASIGTETDGSVVCPASICNVVGLKPTVGLTSRSGVIPNAESQDTIGILARTVVDAAIILAVIAGVDELDGCTMLQPSSQPDYLERLTEDALEGVRLGVPREAFSKEAWYSGDKWAGLSEAFEAALEIFTSLGAAVVEDVTFPGLPGIRDEEDELTVLHIEFKHCLNRYLSELSEVPTGVRTINDVLKYNDDHPEQEKPFGYEDQSRMEAANQSGDYLSPKYKEALADCKRRGREEGIDFALKVYKLDALVFPCYGGTMISAAAIAGYPVITVPLGFTLSSTRMAEPNPTISSGPGLPFGLAFVGTAFTEAKLLSYAHAFEQKMQVRKTFGGKHRVYSEALPLCSLQMLVASISNCP